MRDNRLKATLRSGKSAIGSVLTIPDLFVAELMGQIGMDFLIVETEHSPMAQDTVLDVLIALSGSDSTILVRVPAIADVYIKQALDSGAEGVIVPSVGTRADCEAAVASVRYAPVGSRGFGPRRASRLHGGRTDYLRRANDEVILLIMLETVEGLENLDQILSVEGLDGVLVGPFDLAISMGHVLKPTSDEVDEAIASIHDACRRHNVPFGLFTPTEAQAERWVGAGAQMVTIGSDVAFLDGGAKRSKAAAARILGQVDSREWRDG